MNDRRGSSSYSHGDGGGSCGDYHAQHGVSAAWVKNRVEAGRRKVKAPRRKKFAKNMEKLEDSAFKKMIRIKAPLGSAEHTRLYAHHSRLQEKAKTARRTV